MDTFTPPNAVQALARYREIRERLPAADFPKTSIHRANLADLCNEIDCFVLDGFGVLNVGVDPVPGAVDRINALRAQGKLLRVLTNGASFPATRTREKYRKWGMEFDASEVISSRDALAVALKRHPDMRWGFAALEGSELGTLTHNAVLLQDDAADYASCDGFVLLGVGDWSPHRQRLLADALKQKSRPLFVGNPDLVAPQVGEFSMEPGWFTHSLVDELGVAAELFGKPFDNAFELVRQTLPDDLSAHRIAMVGDTLHTDILGGAQAGWKTILITDHGLLKGANVEQEIKDSGIRPDFIIPTT
ncbi:HAD hydrolase-like protein [Granulosicoccus sp.]|nr:HAD hydrolase-like protein [Granulosicoccus sp.]MDB4222346.1 HAD hydrolase-like protein [Granulosicoccus sp.]